MVESVFAVMEVHKSRFNDFKSCSFLVRLPSLLRAVEEVPAKPVAVCTAKMGSGRVTCQLNTGYVR
jgi:hypothetical protein